MLERYRKYKFLFKQLVKRDFTKKYKRTMLGMAWSIISPLANLAIMYLVFNRLFGSNVNHYAIYLFAGQLVFSYFTDATNMGMTALLNNSGIFTKVNVPKYLFLFSQNVSSLINFALTMAVFFLFVAIEGIPFSVKFLLLLFPTGCMIVFNTGLGLVLSALQVFFRDMQYLWGIATQLIMWLSAVFYTLDAFPENIQRLYNLNPLFVYISYFRSIVLDGVIPGWGVHAMCVGYALAFFGLGCFMYRRYNQEFLYYV